MYKMRMSLFFVSLWFFSNIYTMERKASRVKKVSFGDAVVYLQRNYEPESIVIAIGYKDGSKFEHVFEIMDDSPKPILLTGERYSELREKYDESLLREKYVESLKNIK